MVDHLKDFFKTQNFVACIPFEMADTISWDNALFRGLHATTLTETDRNNKNPRKNIG